MLFDTPTNPDRASNGRKPRAVLLRKFALLLGTCALLLGVTEVVLRMAGYGQYPGRYYETEVGYRFLPNQTHRVDTAESEHDVTYVFNEEGFRGPYFDGPTPAGSTRIACVGDSFTFGWGVAEEETFPAQLASRLAALGRAVEVNNFGVPGYNLWNSCNAYLKYGRPTNPDVVVIAFYLNDVSPRDPGPRNTDSSLMKLLGKSALMEAFHMHLRRHFSYFSMDETEELLAERQVFLENQAAIQIDPYSELAAPFWSGAMEDLGNLVEAAREDADRVLVVAFPSLDQLNRIGSSKEEEFDAACRQWLGPQRRVAEECARLGVPLVDLFEAFYAAEGEPFGSIDAGHPSRLGYSIAADGIATALEALR